MIILRNKSGIAIDVNAKIIGIIMLNVSVTDSLTSLNGSYNTMTY